MRVLFDTNIFILREEDQVLSTDLADLQRHLTELKAEILIHPLSISELKNDKDTKRRDVNLSKIRAYSTLEKPPFPKEEDCFSTVIGSSKSDHDRVDNALLFCVYRNAVDFLLTEDREIHKKAQLLEIEDRVFLVTEALDFIKTILPPKIQVSTPPALTQEHVYNLDIQDPIFHSLIKDYPEFQDWFAKISREGRSCYVNRRSDGSIGALLIYKIEDEEIPTDPPLPQKKRLKIATLKVTHVGYKIGELLIKTAVDIALKHDLDEVYLTHYIEEEDRLVELIGDFGFYQAGVLKKERSEPVFIKHLKPTEATLSLLEPSEISKKYYPSYYDGALVNKIIIPIQPAFHNKLFTDFERGRQSLLFEHNGEFVTEGNTIKKAYLTQSRIQKINPGDILLFYRSRDMHSITSIGVVDQFHPNISPEEIMRIIGKRSVYSKDDIGRLTKNQSIILFRHHFHFKNSIQLKNMLQARILKGAPQAPMQINQAAYEWIINQGDIDESFTFH